MEDYLRPFRRDMDEAMRRYQDIMNHRQDIIEDYIAPYKAKVEEAKRAYEIIRNLHEAVFGR